LHLLRPHSSGGGPSVWSSWVWKDSLGEGKAWSQMNQKYRVLPKKRMVNITRIAGRNKSQGEDQQGIEPRTHTHIYIYTYLKYMAFDHTIWMALHGSTLKLTRVVRGDMRPLPIRVARTSSRSRRVQGMGRPRVPCRMNLSGMNFFGRGRSSSTNMSVSPFPSFAQGLKIGYPMPMVYHHFLHSHVQWP
jgi:hypothetical protein